MAAARRASRSRPWFEKAKRRGKGNGFRRGANAFSNKYGNIAWIFAILGLISSVTNSISSIKSDGSVSGIASAVFSIALSVLILLAAGKVREAWKSER